jgi:AcrR family transcriptional regulator
MARLSTDARRAQLLELGLARFASQPYDAVSIDAIAADAGISKGLLYHYFPSKRDFYAAVLTTAADALKAEIAKHAVAEAPAMVRLHLGLDAYLAYCASHAPAYLALLRGGIGSDPAIAKIVDDQRQWFVGTLLQGMGAGEPPPLVRTAITAWIGAVEAVSVDWVARRDLTQQGVRDLLVAMLAATMMSIGVAPPTS